MTEGINQSSQPRGRPRNIVFFGQSGAGKSSSINLIVGSSVAAADNETGVCTCVSACYKTKIHNEAFNLWDTCGLGEEGFFRSLFKGSSEGDLRRFLGERYQKREIDLLVYCIRGSGGNEALVKNYNTFCAITRRLAAPVVVVVTNLEGEKNMEDWWNRNESSLQSRGMEFDGHACITAIPGHPREDVSKQTLHELIARDYPWQAECGGSYFGSPVQRRERIATPIVPGSTRIVHGDPRSGAARPDAARSEAQSNPGTSPYVESSAVATPSRKSRPSEVRSKVTPNRGAKQSPTGERSNSGADGLVHQAVLSQPSCEESDSAISHLHSMFRTSSGTDCSSRYEPHPQPLAEDHGGRYIDLTAVVKRRKEYPIRSGGFGDIWECDLMTGETPRKVAVKAVKSQKVEGDTQHLAAQKKKLRRELKVWAKLQHENIVELLGIVSGFGVLPSMVSPWFSNESLSSYLSNHKTMNFPKRQGLLSDIASGLRYLHSQGIVHGDLHSGNVLVDYNGRACFTDFGLSLIQDFVGTSYLKSGVCGALRYADPELVQQVHAEGKMVYPTKPSDIYSFGGLTLYVLTGKQPYEGVREILLTASVLRGDRPPLPIGEEQISPKHESLIRRCWSSEESTRPSAEDIITSLHGMSV
ncbi:hypothetical protein PAXINDRAFT_97096 [Paxillus involutus ATCC 200175]|nr:hypothetical protein PAXINDRAFT_97096 [Paxillus involutus ATCC 200175]